MSFENSPKPKPIAEQEGMTFEQRCDTAKTHLQQTWTWINGLADEDLRTMQESGTIPENLLPGTTRKSRAALRSLAEALDEGLKESSATYRDQLWQNAVRFTRETLGDDATDFALTAIHRQSPGH